jgi:dTDP-glucose pyrophosphorylase
MYNQANQITKAVCDMTPQEKEEILKALTMEQNQANQTMEQKDATAMDASSVLDVKETDDTTLASSTLQKNSKKQKRKELSETRTIIRTRKSTKTSDA